MTAPPRKKIALFSTTNLHKTTPYSPGQEAVHTVRNDAGETIVNVYSSGKIEMALKRGYEVYVVSLLPAPMEYHRWFIKLLPAENVFFTTGIFEEMNRPEMNSSSLETATTEPWRKLYAKLGIDWPTHVTNSTQARLHLVMECGVLDGESLHGFGVN